MKNFIDEAIKMLQELKENEGIGTDCSVSYDNDRAMASKGVYEIKPNGNFYVQIYGCNLQIETP